MAEQEWNDKMTIKIPRNEPHVHYGWMIVGIVISLPIALVAWVWFIALAVRLAMQWGWLP